MCFKNAFGLVLLVSAVSLIFRNGILNRHLRFPNHDTADSGKRK
jgi:hypothetical protein